MLFRSADIPSVSLWAAVPAYASQLPSPKAALALVDRACEMIGTPSPHGTLAAAADKYDLQVSAYVADNDDLVAYLDRLESMDDDDLFEDDEDDDSDGDDSDPDADAVPAPALGDDVDSAELMAEVEQFLREQDGPDR